MFTLYVTIAGFTAGASFVALLLGYVPWQLCIPLAVIFGAAWPLTILFSALAVLGLMHEYGEYLFDQAQERAGRPPRER